MSAVSTFVVVTCAIVLLALLLPASSRPILLGMLIGLSTGWAISHLLYTPPAESTLTPPADSFTGTVQSDPRMTSRGAQVWLRWHDGEGTPNDVRAYLPLSQDVRRGDRVSVQGDGRIDTSGAVVFARRVDLVGPTSAVESSRSAIRDYASDAMVAHVPGSPGSLTLGLLVGDDTALSTDERSDLRASGLAHITAVSGWNVSLLVVSIGAFFRAFGARKWRWLAVQIVLLAVYVWVVGLEPPIIRAAIMGTVALVALQFGRPAHLLTHLTIAAGIMAVIEPEIIDSLSFQLSFLAMLGLAAAVRITRDLDGWKRALLSPAIAASCAGIATAPLLGAAFGTLALMTVPANLAAGPLVSFTTLGGIVVVLTSWFWPAAELAGWATWILSRLILDIAAFFAHIPGGHHTFAPLSPEVTVLIYAVLALVVAPLFPRMPSSRATPVAARISRATLPPATSDGPAARGSTGGRPSRGSRTYRPPKYSETWNTSVVSRKLSRYELTS